MIPNSDPRDLSQSSLQIQDSLFLAYFLVQVIELIQCWLLKVDLDALQKILTFFQQKITVYLIIKLAYT